jgi:hypothetical protein
MIMIEVESKIKEPKLNAGFSFSGAERRTTDDGL